MIFLTWYSFLKKYCAILPKYKTIFFVSGTIAAAIQNQVQQNICRTAANTAAVIEAAAHIRLLHLLVGETRGFQLLYQFLIFIIVGFHLCSGSGILESHSVVAGTRMCYSRNIVPLGVPVADTFQYADSFGKSAVANEVYGSLQVNAVLVAGSRRGVPVVEVAISAGVLVLAFVHDRLVCLLDLLELFFIHFCIGFVHVGTGVIFPAKGTISLFHFLIGSEILFYIARFSHIVLFEAFFPWHL